MRPRWQAHFFRFICHLEEEDPGFETRPDSSLLRGPRTGPQASPVKELFARFRHGTLLLSVVSESVSTLAGNHPIYNAAQPLDFRQLYFLVNRYADCGFQILALSHCCATVLIIRPTPFKHARTRPTVHTQICRDAGGPSPVGIEPVFAIVCPRSGRCRVNKVAN